jgi:putative Holliday junction resolvase
MTNILAIDYGTRHTGIAYQLGSTNPIIPADTINTDNNQTLIDLITQICKEKEITDIVIGLPLTLAGEIGHQAKIVQDFANQLQISLPKTQLHFLDERFSTKFVDENMTNSDSYAAYEILDIYIKRSANEKK